MLASDRWFSEWIPGLEVGEAVGVTVRAPKLIDSMMQAKGGDPGIVNKGALQGRLLHDSLQRLLISGTLRKQLAARGRCPDFNRLESGLQRCRRIISTDASLWR